jgi:hypothetical protein
VPWIRNRRAGGSSSRGRSPSLLLRCSWVDSVCADGATEILRESAMISCLATRKELFSIAPVAHLNAGSFSKPPTKSPILVQQIPLLLVLNTEPFELRLSRFRPRPGLSKRRVSRFRPLQDRIRDGMTSRGLELPGRLAISELGR